MPIDIRTMSSGAFPTPPSKHKSSPIAVEAQATPAPAPQNKKQEAPIATVPGNPNRTIGLANDDIAETPKSNPTASIRNRGTDIGLEPGSDAPAAPVSTSSTRISGDIGRKIPAEVKLTQQAEEALQLWFPTTDVKVTFTKSPDGKPNSGSYAVTVPADLNPGKLAKLGKGKLPTTPPENGYITISRIPEKGFNAKFNLGQPASERGK